MKERRNEWREEFRVAGDQVGRTIRELVREGNARKIIVRRPTGEIIREISLTRGVAAGALLALIAPALAAIGAVVALLSEVRIEVVRERTDEPSAGAPEPGAGHDPGSASANDTSGSESP